MHRDSLIHRFSHGDIRFISFSLPYIFLRMYPRFFPICQFPHPFPTPISVSRKILRVSQECHHPRTKHTKLAKIELERRKEISRMSRARLAKPQRQKSGERFARSKTSSISYNTGPFSHPKMKACPQSPRYQFGRFWRHVSSRRATGRKPSLNVRKWEE